MKDKKKYKCLNCNSEFNKPSISKIDLTDYLKNNVCPFCYSKDFKTNEYLDFQINKYELENKIHSNYVNKVFRKQHRFIKFIGILLLIISIIGIFFLIGYYLQKYIREKEISYFSILIKLIVIIDLISMFLVMLELITPKEYYMILIISGFIGCFLTIIL